MNESETDAGREPADQAATQDRIRDLERQLAEERAAKAKDDAKNSWRNVTKADKPVEFEGDPVTAAILALHDYARGQIQRAQLADRLEVVRAALGDE